MKEKIEVDVLVGDVYVDLDYRAVDRRVVVVAIEGDRAIVRNVDTKVIARIRLDRLRPITPRKGYRLIERDGQNLSPEGVVDLSRKEEA